MTTYRHFWNSEIQTALKARNVVWLAGVRRAGKTTLARSIPDADYYDCELVRVRRSLEEPELFLRSKRGTIILDEIHRLANPSEVLKVAADHFPKLHVVATGSSTLQARHKFRDSLTGRKRELHLLPLVWSDLEDFRNTDVDHRMLQGGLPPFFLARKMDDKDYEEWLSSYWAKDLTELFVVEKKNAFMKFVELLFAQSGGAFEAQSFAAPCEISRPTVQQYLQILETTLLATVVRPYFGGLPTEIKGQPKVYAFDTGFVAYFKGWDSLRDDDRGVLLEHLVLAELCARFDMRRIHYWRDKQKHEVDFVLEVGRRRKLVAIECKVNPTKYDSSNLSVFRRKYPAGTNLVVTLQQTRSYEKRHQGLDVIYVPFGKLSAVLDELRDS